jgi:hypothetical protein
MLELTTEREPVASDVEHDVAEGPGTNDRSAVLAIWRGRLLSTAGVLVPLGLMTWVAGRSVLNFDGGMNMQIASSLADGRGYAWDYGAHVISPDMVQTSGPFLFVEALGIRLFGTTAWALQFANLVFVAVLLLAVIRTLRPSRTLQVVGPAVFLLITPDVVDIGLGGYGEFAIAGLMLWSCLLLSQAAEGHHRPLLLCTASGLIFGISLTIKFIAIAALPALVVGYVIVAICRSDVSRRALALSWASTLVPVIAFEVYRASQFGSLSMWLSYWRQQLSAVGSEGSGPTAIRGSLLRSSTGWPRLEYLGDHVGIQMPALLIVFLLLPLIALAVSFRQHVGSWRPYLRRPRRALAVMLSVVVALYMPWYFFVSPIDWLRHMAVGWIALSVLYLLLVDEAFTWWRERLPATGSRWVMRALAVATTLTVTCICAARFAMSFALDVAHPPYADAASEQAVSRYVVSATTDGAQFCGLDIEFASVVMVTAHVPFCDLNSIEPCSLQQTERFDAGKVLVVWDPRSTEHFPAGPPGDATYTYTKAAQPSSYASIWRVSLRPDVCGP